jgi:hypothetical protein
MKRPWYVDDGPSRREQLTDGLDIPAAEYAGSSVTCSASRP